MNQLYLSRELKYKSPYGAVCAGETVHFNVYPPRARAITELSLFIAQDDNEREQHSIAMVWSGLDGARDRYTAAYTVPRAGLYWYYFRIRTAGKVYYISRGSGGCDSIGEELTQRFQLTAYDKNYQVASWFGQGITYNIFPDRFCRSHMPAKTGYRAERVIHEDWNELPEYRPNEQGEILNCDFFGGNLQGVMEKLPYLASLHVSTIYFNPIFEAYSNHRYDTGDYKTIDPMLGTNEDFRQLCQKAEEYGMRVMLDGVFNHTGYDSRYFNARGHYDSVGAYQSQQSPYYEWYDFTQWPNQYGAWWGIYTLPQVNETNASYLDYIITGQDSVIQYWLKQGAYAWRLDVADELPDSFIAMLNTAARQAKPDAMVLGEVWEDASNKIAYDVRRRYFAGGELDSVMNYPLREAILKLVAGGNAREFVEIMESLRENYPHDVFYNLMNIVGTHDTPRILTVLGSPPELWQGTRQERAEYRLPPELRAKAVRLLRLAAVLQFTMPGSPCIYYGDEAGVEGYEDPFNRRTYPWGAEDTDILSFYQHLTGLRAESDALCFGTLRFYYAQDAVLAYLRESAAERIAVVVNCGKMPHTVALPCAAAYEMLTGRIYDDPAGTGVPVTVSGESAGIYRMARA